MMLTQFFLQQKARPGLYAYLPCAPIVGAAVELLVKELHEIILEVENVAILWEWG